jgi:hypothetical protein
MHGGKAPQVQQAARERIASMVHPALNALQRALDSNDIHAAIRAARDVLDRAGYAPRHGVDLAVTSDPFGAVERAVREANAR